MQKTKLVLAALMTGSLTGTLMLGDTLPADAAGTAAGTAISNTATATYTDPNNPGTTLNATSNTVSITVAEVAGITVSGGVPTDTTPGHAGNFLPGDVLNYDFTVTNIGNAPNPFALPGAATLTGPGTAGTLQYSTDGGANFITVPTGGVTTAAIPANAAVIVRVPVTISAGRRPATSSKSSLAMRAATTTARRPRTLPTQRPPPPTSTRPLPRPRTGCAKHPTSAMARSARRRRRSPRCC